MIVIKRLKNLDYYFQNLTQLKLEEVIKPVRFYRNKAKWLAEAKSKFIDIIYTVRSNSSDYVKRDWLVKSVKGFGWKTASHFLRNLGATDLAIIDTHVLKFLGVGGRAGTFRLSYMDLEDRFMKIANRRKLNVAELDIVVWKKYSNTEWGDYLY
jgi:N-glycosylase/DNA lyase